MLAIIIKGASEKISNRNLIELIIHFLAIIGNCDNALLSYNREENVALV